MRRAFTVIELLIAIGVIAIVLAILLPGLRVLANQSKARDTRNMLETGRNLLANLELTTGSQVLVPNTPQTVGDVGEQGADRRGTVVQNTAGAIRRMCSVPDNKRIFDELPAVKKMQVGGNPVLLDGWGNPMILIAPEGLNTTVNGAPQLIKSRDGKAFWASAGPDGDFSKGDDNLYSGEN